jgi:hypothetical protein
MKTVKRFPDKFEREGMRLDNLVRYFFGSKIRIDKRGVEFTLPVRVGSSAEVGGYGEEVVVAVEQALWLRDRVEHFRKGQVQ